MATGTSQVGMNIQYNRERITIYARKEERVGSVIARAVKQLELPEGNRFTLLHQGNRIRDDVPVEVAVANKTTVLFLQKTSEDQIKSTLVLRQESNSQNNSKYGFCKTCGYLCQTRPIYTCNLCRKNCFVLDKEVDFFDEESVLQMSGVCSNCDNTKPSVQYICRACEDENSTVPFLPQIRDNIHNKPCMKCSEKEERVLLFTCQSRHSMCIECFVSMCYMKLSCGEFKNFETGYSVACPGPGADCNKSPIVDPHHFYVVDNAKDFYAKFKELSFKEWLPPGENIICDQCQVEIDLSSGKEVPVTQPATDDPQATVPGSAWMFWKKFFSRPQSQPQPAPPMMRKQVACFKCNRQFCCICKHLWHEGNCVQLSEEAERQAKEFTIDPEQARLSCWPAT